MVDARMGNGLHMSGYNRDTAKGFSREGHGMQRSVAMPREDLLNCDEEAITSFGEIVQPLTKDRLHTVLHSNFQVSNMDTTIEGECGV